MKKETKRAIRDAFAKLSFRSQAQNPVMLMVYLSACLTTVLLALALAGISDAPWGYIAAICVVLWATVLFGNFAESLAEGRGKAQADALRSAKRDVEACLIDNAALADAATMEDPSAFLADRGRAVGSATLKRGQVYLVRAGEQVPADGEVIMGAASVDESAITGESAPVVRESGGDRSSITGGTTVLSDWLVARVTAEAGQSFLDKMIAMVESAARKKTPNEQALELLLIALTLVFLAVSLSLYLFGAFTAAQHGAGNPLGITSLVALFVCLAPTTIGALLSAIGIAGMSRLNAANVLATSGRAVEAAGDVDVLLLDKTGTITLGNRQAAAFLPVGGVSERELADAAQLASLTDETPEGRSVVGLAKERFGIRERELAQSGFAVVPFTAQTRMSGVDFEGHEIRKGAADAVRAYVEARGGVFGAEVAAVAEAVEAALGAGCAPEDVYVLTFHPAWMRQVLRALAARDIAAAAPVEGRLSVGDYRDLDRCAPARLLAALDLAADPANALAWRSWCGFGDYLANSAAFADMRAGAAAEGAGLVALLEEASAAAPAEGFPNTGIGRIVDAYRAGRELVASVQGLEGDGLLDALAAGLGLEGDGAARARARPAPDRSSWTRRRRRLRFVFGG